MAKVVVAKVASKRRGRPKTVAVWRVRNRSGKFVEKFTVDPESRTFGDDLTYVFDRNVTRVRKQNKSWYGSADGFGKAHKKLKSPGLSDVGPKK